MQKLAQWVVKYAWPIFIATLVATFVFGYLLRDLRFEDDVTKYLPESDPEVFFYNSLEDKFSGFQTKSLIVGIEFDNLFTVEHLQGLNRLVEEIEKLSSVRSVTALTNMPKIVSTEFGVEVKEVVEVLPESEAEAEKLREELKEDELIWGKMVTEDGKATMVVVSFYDDVDEYKAIEEVEMLCEKYNPGGKVTVFGVPVITRLMAQDSRRTMSTLTPFAALVLIVILYWGFRALRGVFLPILISLISSVWVLGCAVVMGKSLTVVASSMPVLLLSLVTAYGIHFVNRYYEERACLNGPEASAATLRDIFTPILMSALTTMGGFLSLLTAEIKPISDFGLYSALGIFFGMILATFSLGSFYAIFVPRKVPNHFRVLHQGRERGDLISRFLRFIARSVLHHKKATIAFIVIMMVIFTLGIPRIDVETSVKVQMGKNHPITLLLDYFEKRFGSTDYNYLCVRSQNVKEPFVLREMVRIGKYAARFKNFEDASSLATFLMNLNQAMEGWKAIPIERDKIDNLWFFAQDNSYLKGRISEGEDETLVEFSAEETSSSELREEVAALEEFLKSRPQRVKMVSIKEPGAVDFLVDTIVEDLRIFGLEVSNPEVLKEEIKSIVEKPVEAFVGHSADFAFLVAHDATLEIEDLGLSVEEVALALENHYKSNNLSISELLERELGLSEDDALYLEEVLKNSELRIARKMKAETVRKVVENMTGEKLNEDFDFVFYEALDEWVYLPAPDGPVTVEYKVTGAPIISNYVNSKLFNQQARSMFLAFVIVFGLLLLQLRSLRKASIAIVPILLTVYTSFGIMGLLKIPLNVATLMVASIAIGAGIDYTIHFTSRWYRELSLQNPKALMTTMLSSGRGIVLNSLAIAGGNYVLATGGISMLRMFGGLVGTVLLVSVLYALVLLPLLLHAESYLGNNNKNIEKQSGGGNA